MSVSETHDEWGLSPSGVALLTAPAATYATIKTEASGRLSNVVDEFFDQLGPESSREGRAIFISGAFGTGKTHLAREALQQIRKRDKQGARALEIVVTQPVDSFSETVRNFIVPAIGRERAVRAVQAMFAKAIAFEIGETLLHDQVEELLVHPEGVVPFIRQHGLDQSHFRERLREELKGFPEVPDEVAEVLLLLTYPSLEEAAWNWLEGASLSEELRDRGIGEPGASALHPVDVVCALLLTLQRADTRASVIMDEAQRFFLGAEETVNDAPAFKRFIEGVVRAGGLLICAGSTSFWNSLTQDVRERFSFRIEQNFFDEEDVQSLAEQVIGRIGPGVDIKFPARSAKYLREVTAGRPRDVVAVLRKVLLRAQAADRSVNAESIRESAREIFEEVSEEAFADEVRKSFGQLHKKFEEVEKNRIFVVGIGDGEDKCAVALSNSLFLESDVTRLRGVVEGANLPKGTPSLLLVNGILSDAVAGQIPFVKQWRTSRVGSVHSILSEFLATQESSLQARRMDTALSDVRREIQIVSRVVRDLSISLDRRSREDFDPRSNRLYALRASDEILGNLLEARSRTALPASLGVLIDPTLSRLAFARTIFSRMMGLYFGADFFGRGVSSRLKGLRRPLDSMLLSEAELDSFSNVLALEITLERFRGRVAEIVLARAMYESRSDALNDISLACKSLSRLIKRGKRDYRGSLRHLLRTYSEMMMQVYRFSDDDDERIHSTVAELNSALDDLPEMPTLVEHAMRGL